jgi:hypothetical protein
MAWHGQSKFAGCSYEKTNGQPNGDEGNLSKDGVPAFRAAANPEKPENSVAIWRVPTAPSVHPIG